DGDDDVTDDPPRRPPREREQLAVVAAVELGGEALEDAARADVLLERDADADGDEDDERPRVEAVAAGAALDLGLGVELAPGVDRDPAQEAADGAHEARPTNAASWRSRWRLSSLPRTSIVANSGGDALRPVTPRRR